MNERTLIPILICCVYPIVAPIIVSYGWRWFTQRDWTALRSFRLSDIMNVFRKDTTQ